MLCGTAVSSLFASDRPASWELAWSVEFAEAGANHAVEAIVGRTDGSATVLVRSWDPVPPHASILSLIDLDASGRRSKTRVLDESAEGSPGRRYCTGLLELPDQELALTGRFGLDRANRLWRLSANRQVLRHHELTGEVKSDSYLGMTKLADGGFGLSGFFAFQAVQTRLDKDGKVTDRRTDLAGERQVNQLRQMIPLPESNGSIALLSSGDLNKFGLGACDSLLVRLDADGKETVRKKFAGRSGQLLRMSNPAGFVLAVDDSSEPLANPVAYHLDEDLVVLQKQKIELSATWIVPVAFAASEAGYVAVTAFQEQLSVMGYDRQGKIRSRWLQPLENVFHPLELAAVGDQLFIGVARTLPDQTVRSLLIRLTPAPLPPK